MSSSAAVCHPPYLGCPSHGRGGQRGWGFHIPGRPRNKTLTLRTIPVTIFSHESGRSSETYTRRPEYPALLHHRLYFIRSQPGAGLRYIGNILEDHHVVGIFDYGTLCRL